MKKILIIAILMVSVVLLSGCVEVTYGFYIKSNGSVERKYNVIVDPEWSSGPYNAEYALEIATLQLEGMLEDNPEYGEIIVNEDNPFDVSLVYKYKDLNEYYRAMGITGDDKPEPDNSIKTYEMFFVNSQTLMFTDVNQQFVNSYISSVRNGAFPSLSNIPYQDIVINLDYSTKYTKAYSSNATTEINEGDTKIFRWTANASTGLSYDRILYIRQPNYAVWYSLSIGGSIIISLLLFIIIKMSRRNANG